MHREGEVLVDTSIAPPDTLGVRIGRFVRFDTRELAHLPLSFANFFQIDPRARHALDMIFFIQPPAPHMVRAGDHTRRKTFGDPGVQDEETDFSVNFQQIAGVVCCRASRHR